MNKNIYKYNDGNRDVYADPADLDYRLIKAFEKDEEKFLKRLRREKTAWNEGSYLWCEEKRKGD